MLTDSREYQQFVGKERGGVYIIKTSRFLYQDWKLAAGDFMEFQETAGKNVILVMSEAEFAEVRREYQNHSSRECVLRENEPRVLVHSTTMNNWLQIQKDGMLKSWNRLRADGAQIESQPIGAQLGDPADFSNFIMFGGGVTGEIVVNSKQTGRIVMDIDCAYHSGARLYFDAEKIARDGLLIRDGAHVKVEERLPLDPYLIWAATWRTLNLPGQITTPRLFAELADRQFSENFHFPI